MIGKQVDPSSGLGLPIPAGNFLGDDPEAFADDLIRLGVIDTNALVPLGLVRFHAVEEIMAGHHDDPTGLEPTVELLARDRKVPAPEPEKHRALGDVQAIRKVIIELRHQPRPCLPGLLFIKRTNQAPADIEDPVIAQQGGHELLAEVPIGETGDGISVGQGLRKFGSGDNNSCPRTGKTQFG